MIFKRKLVFKVVLVGFVAYLLTSFFLIGKDVYHVMNIEASKVEYEPVFAKHMCLEKEVRSVPRESFLTAKLAISNDEFLKNGYKHWTLLPATAIGSRLMAATVFPITLASDFVYATGMSLYSKTTGNFENATWYRMRAFKNLLGLFATPASLFGADLVTNHFIPLEKSNSAICPYGKLYSAHAMEFYPKTVEEVQEILHKAKKFNKKITIAGKLFSQGKQALPSDYKDILLHTDFLDEVVVDADKKVVLCGPGATWEKVQEAANEKALAVQVMQASNIFSVGGSLSINCHGWDHKRGSLDQTVLAIHLINHEGTLLRLTPKDELFHLAIGGLGGFGVIVKAEIALVDNELLNCQGEIVDPSSYVNYFREKVLADPAIALHYYRLSLEPGKLFREGVAVNYTSQGPSESSILTSLTGEPDKGSRLDRIELQTLRRVKALRKLAWKEEKLNALEPVLGTRNQLMQPSIRAILSASNLDVEWLQEYFVKPEYLEPFLGELASILNRHKVPIFNASVRYVAKNSCKSFNYAPDGERFAIVLFFNQSLKPQDIAHTKKWMNEVLSVLERCKGSYYLPYQAIPSLEQFRKSYPNWKQVQELKRKWDPSNRFNSGFFSHYLSTSEEIDSRSSSKYQDLFAKETGMREEIRDFLDNIFMQLDSPKLFSLMDKIFAEQVSDEEVYPLLLSQISEAKNGFFSNLLASLRSLRSLQNELGDQVKSLLHDEPFDGYVEIGYPGRMIKPLKKRLNLSGKMIVVNTEQRFSDHIEAGIPSPTDLFVPLHDYEPLNAEIIPSESADLVSLFIGLHHIPKEKLNPFIRSIERVLRPGGKLILMDHDASSEKMESFLSLVHSLFNAGTKVSVQDEESEYRNFRSLSYWIDLAAENGLIWDGQKPLVRQGDPTLNSIIILKKPKSEAVPCPKDTAQTRPGIQTYLTGPEWQNVRSTQTYAAFIEHTPFYQFPYFREIKNFWHVYRESWKAARKHYSFYQTLTAEHTLMNTFIGVMMTVEYTCKGLISAPLSWFYTQEEHKESLITTILLQEHEANSPTYLDIPRYRKSTPILIDLAMNGTEFISICGEKRIQFDLLLEENAPLPTSLRGAKFLYEIPLIQNPKAKLAAYEIPVCLLAEALRQSTKEGLTVDYIHDF